MGQQLLKNAARVSRVMARDMAQFVLNSTFNLAISMKSIPV